jgi:hypothetical protein
LISLAYSYEQATRHRRPPQSAPPVGRSPKGGEHVAMSPVPAAGGVTFSVVATGAQAVPRSNVTFELGARLVFDERTNRLSYTLTLAGGSRDRVNGVYLHRRLNRPNGGVAHILAKSPRFPITGFVTLLPADVVDLKAGKCYISAISASSPLRAARANIVWP